jgi:hypothetical protein
VADIDVVKGRSHTWVWWVLGLVVLALVLMFMLRGRDANAPARSSSSAFLPAASLSMRVA